VTVGGPNRANFFWIGIHTNVSRAELHGDGLGDALLALLDKLARGLDDARMREFVHAQRTTRRASTSLSAKGERKLALQLLTVLYERGYRDPVLAVTEMLTSFGCEGESGRGGGGRGPGRDTDCRGGRRTRKRC